MHQIGQRQRRFRVKQFFFLFQRACNAFLTFFTDITMSETKDDSSGLEEAQKNQKKAGAAEMIPRQLGLQKT